MKIPLVLVHASLLLVTGFGILQTPASAQMEQIWSGDDPDFLTGDISPDGRYFSDINWDTGDLELVDLESGDTLALTGTSYDEGRYAWSSAFSTNGQRLALSAYVYEAGSHELRVANLSDRTSRLLVAANEEFDYIDPLDWSPADEYILVALRRPDYSWQLGLVGAEDGSLRVIKTLSWLAPGGEQSYPNAYLSTDGKYVAYDYRPDLERYDRDIYAFSIDGNHEVKLVSGSGADRFLGWSTDGRRILFYSDRSGAPGVWQLSVRDGKPAGEPELVQADLPGLVPLGITHAGYVFGVSVEEPRIHTIEVDLDAGQVLMPPQAVDDPPSRRSLAGDWSPDGRRLAYYAHDPFPKAVETLVIRSAAGDKISEMPLSSTMHTSNAAFRWLDDETIVSFAVVKGRRGIYRLDPRDGSYDELAASVVGLHGVRPGWFEIAPSGGTLYVFQNSDEQRGASELLRIDIDNAEASVLGIFEVDHQSLALSPNGGELAFIERKKGEAGFLLNVIASSGSGTARTLYNSSGDERLLPPTGWSADGSRIIFVQSSPHSGRVLVSAVADGSDKPVRVEGEFACCYGYDIRAHPNGRRFALTTGGSRGEVWTLRY